MGQVFGSDLLDPQTYANVAGNIVNTMTAAAQRTTPAVRDLQGNLNYTRLGDPIVTDAYEGYVDANGKWQLFDPTRHVLLTDPQTKQPGVFARSEVTNTSVPVAAGEMLGIGMQAPGTVRVAGATIGLTLTGTAEQRAAARVGTAIAADVAAGAKPPPTLAEAIAPGGAASVPLPPTASTLQHLTTAPPPLMLADVGGENVRGLAGQATRLPGPGRQYGVELLNLRDVGAGQRLTCRFRRSRPLIPR